MLIYYSVVTQREKKMQKMFDELAVFENRQLWRKLKKEKKAGVANDKFYKFNHTNLTELLLLLATIHEW